jgi:hypothetical protein
MKSKNPPYQLLFSLSYTLGSASDEKKEERERERGEKGETERHFGIPRIQSGFN